MYIVCVHDAKIEKEKYLNAILSSIKDHILVQNGGYYIVFNN